MVKKAVPKGYKKYGEKPVTIDDITTNAVIIVRAKNTPKYGVLNLGVEGSLSPDKVIELIKGFIDEYVQSFKKRPQGLEAAIIGGEFQENRNYGGVIVYHKHDMVKRQAAQALKVCNIDMTEYETDPLGTKKVRISRGGQPEITSERVGLNKLEATLSEFQYENIHRHNEY